MVTAKYPVGTCWQVMKHGCAVLANIGAEFHLDEQLQKDIEVIVCKLYNGKEETSMNLLCYHMFKQGKFSDAMLPPNQDCLLKHAQRANYQAAIWKRSTIPLLMHQPLRTMVGSLMQKATFQLFGWMEAVPQMFCWRIAIVSARPAAHPTDVPASIKLL